LIPDSKNYVCCTAVKVHPDDGGSMNVRNVIPPQHYTASQPAKAKARQKGGGEKKNS
jgi:hypothetical protein